MTVRIFHGDVPAASVPADDRGLAYGDGLFETMRVHRGRVHWWQAHWQRLVQGAGRLGLPLPDAARVQAEAGALCATADDAVLRLVLSRGPGRGYAPPAAPVPTWVLSLHPLPPPVPAAGLVLRWCDLRLAEQPALAGIKHCNRLEQVLARSEWRDPDIHEGLLCSSAGEVVSATAANLCVFDGAHWLTPPVDRCGVAGVCRGWLLAEGAVREARIQRAQLESAAAVVLCNAVRGILPVVRLGERTWRPHAAVADLQRRLGAAHPAFVSAEEA